MIGDVVADASDARPSREPVRDDQEMSEALTTPSMSVTTETTTSWMREAGMDADIRSYSRSALLRRNEYFFRIWHYAKELFK
jgi:hypothetical protein